MKEGVIVRILVLLFLLISFKAFGADHFECSNNSAQLDIKITETAEQKDVHWELKLIGDQNILLEGQGEWQKESESEDAFSSIGETSAISYKNQRAVLVFSDDQGIYFPSCEIKK